MPIGEEHRKELMRIAGRDICFDRPMRLYTTFRVGGCAGAFLRAGNLEVLRAVLDLIGKERIPWLVIGKGSNLLVNDRGFEGVVIRLVRELAFTHLSHRRDELVVGAGTPNKRLLGYCMEEGLSGLEFLSGIPGTSGGAVVMNAGAFGRETAEAVKRVGVLSPSGEEAVIEAADLEFGYRVAKIPSGFIITQVDYEVRSGNRKGVAKAVRKNLDQRRRSQPHGFPSAGSVFKNPPGDYAGRLIETAGLKGKRIGGARISTVNANWIENTGGATAADILNLMGIAREEVKRMHGIRLESEIQPVGF